jgi:ribose transport system ATP-binding protein
VEGQIAHREDQTRPIAGSAGLILEMRGIAKRFPGVVALDNVDYACREGEVHALVGENGAGKSTLIKILSGAHTADAGEIYFRNQPVRIFSPEDSFRQGIGIIYQDLNLSPFQTVEQNILLGIEPTKFGGFLDNKLIRQRSLAILRETLKSALEPRAIVGELSIAEQQLVAIAKALQHCPKILVMDEPTSSLSDREREMLFDLILDLKSKGMTFIYITHRLKELFQISDRVSVLKDGRMVGCRETGEIDEDEVISMMVGRKSDDIYPAKEEHGTAGEEILEVRNLSRREMYRGLSFHVRRGEILGITGLVGSGKTELAKTIFGAIRPQAGEIIIRGQSKIIRSPRQARSLGVGMVPEDRKTEGLSLILSVSHNVCMSIWERITRFGLVNRRVEREYTQSAIRNLNVRTPSPDFEVQHLSGGNQQKIVIAKWLATKPDLLIFDEPTQGVDVGARSDIYRLIRNEAGTGKGVLLISSDYLEVIGLADRVLVMHEGAFVGELKGKEITEQAIMALAAGLKSKGAKDDQD